MDFYFGYLKRLFKEIGNNLVVYHCQSMQWQGWKQEKGIIG
jgi:hypothetical protein